MASALTADADRVIKGNITNIKYPIKASTTIPKGALVAIEDGYLISATNSAANVFAGRATEGVTRGATLAAFAGVATFGTTRIHVYWTGGTCNLSMCYGADCYVVNNDTVGTKTAASLNYVGIIVDVIDGTNKIVEVLLTKSLVG